MEKQPYEPESKRDFPKFGFKNTVYDTIISTNQQNDEYLSNHATVFAKRKRVFQTRKRTLKAHRI